MLARSICSFGVLALAYPSSLLSQSATAVWLRRPITYRVLEVATTDVDLVID